MILNIHPMPILMQKMKNEIDKYLLQYRDIYSSEIFVGNIKQESFSLESIGNKESDIVFVEDFIITNEISFKSRIKKSHDLFKNILKSIGLSYTDVQIIRVTRIADFEINNMICNSFDKKLNNKKIIISLGAKFLIKDKDTDCLRSNLYKYKNIDLMHTYHPIDLIENQNLKRYVWDDFKFLRDRYLNG